MGVVEAMVHSELPGPIKSTNSICSEERSGRFVMDNCDVGLSKYKRRKVSAVRDFPSCCGRVSSQINLRPVDDATCAGTTEDLLCRLPGVPTNSDVHFASKLAPGCSPVSPKTNIRPEAAFDGNTRHSDVHVALDSPGCRSVSPQISLRPAKNGITDDSLGGPTRTLDLHVATKVVESVAEQQAMFTYQGDGQKSKDVEPLNTLSDEDLEGLKESGSIDHGKSIEHDASSLSKDFREICDPIPSKKISHSIFKNRLVHFSVSVNSNGGGLENVAGTNFLHRRRVSAVRDFPSFCGRDAPLLSKGEYGSLRGSANEKSVGQENSGFDNKPSNRIVSKYDKKKGENNQLGKVSDECLENTSIVNVDKVQADSKVIYFQESGATEEIGNGDEARREKVGRPYLNKLKHFNIKSDRNVNLDEKPGKEYRRDISSKKKLSDQYVYRSGQKKESLVSSEILSDKIVVQALMASSNCPWRQGKSIKGPESGISKIGQGKKQVAKQVGIIKFFARTKDKDKDFDKYWGKKSKMSSKATHGDTVQLVIREEDMFEPDNVPRKISKMTANGIHGDTDQHLIQGEDMSELNHDDFHVGRSSHDYDVSVTPFGQRSLNGNSLGSDAIIPRTKVRETLRLFQALCRKLLQEEEARSKKDGNSHKRVDLQAAKILKDKGKYVNEGKQILGSVPGVEVGDEFRYRVELNIIGLHRQIQGGIDYVKHDGKILATSIVASGGYSDDLDCSDTLVYTGQGGNMMHSGKEPEDQKLERGNLAMKNSLDERNSVRVIRGSDVSEGRTYVYDGLYLVDKWWQDVGPHGKLVFKFLLNRIPDQPELAWKEVKKSKKFKVREGLCVDDISQGKECCPISAVNTVDEEKPPPFTYITRIIYPDWCRPVPPKGCDCTNGCSDSEKCSCAVKNGGELPYNYNEAIVEAKPLVYECGPSCKCPSSCSNRVSQKGIKFQLEIFKTKSRGWGVRSLNSIPSGSFICEYVGELIDEKEAEQRSNDEYLFDIGNNYNDSSLWDGLSTLMPEIQASSSNQLEEGNFTIDAAEFGNVGRFINHCCSPNLYAQNVLYDYEDKRVPHIMLFAAENIPPLQELTYHYNYVIGQVRDSDGNIKKKSCYCGSVECTGRMY